MSEGERWRHVVVSANSGDDWDIDAVVVAMAACEIFLVTITNHYDIMTSEIMYLVRAEYAVLPHFLMNTLAHMNISL